MNTKVNLAVLAASIATFSAYAADDQFAEKLESLALADRAKQYDAVIEQGTSLIRELKFRPRTDTAILISAAKIRKAGISVENFYSVTEADHEEFRLETSIRSYQNSVAIALNNRVVFESLANVWYELGKTDFNIYMFVSNILRNKLFDLDRAFSYAKECGDSKGIISMITYSGHHFTDDDVKLLIVSINSVLDNPNETISTTQVKEWAGKTLVNLYTTGKIDKKIFVDTLKKMYKRCRLYLANDRKNWETPIATIKFGIINADKILSDN